MPFNINPEKKLKVDNIIKPRLNTAVGSLSTNPVEIKALNIGINKVIPNTSNTIEIIEKTKKGL